jgi:hypothetical protein
MSRVCPTCGFVSTSKAPSCELCGAPRPAPSAEAPHRVPSHFGSRTSDGATDQGYHEVPPTVRLAEATRRRSGTITDIGEQAARAAASPARLNADPHLTEPSPEDDLNPGPSLLGKLKLVVEQGLIIGEQYLLSEPMLVIGRADQAAPSYPDIDLGAQDNDYVHRLHARLQFHDFNTRLSVEHLGGANPTLVNNQPVAARELVELVLGDRLRVGRVVMRLTRV